MPNEIESKAGAGNDSLPINSAELNVSGTIKPPLFVEALGSIMPRLNGESIALLKQPDIARIAEETGIYQSDLNELVWAHKLSADTELPADALFALAKNGGPTARAELAAADSDDVRRKIESAVKDNVVPAETLSKFDAAAHVLDLLQSNERPLQMLVENHHLEIPGFILRKLNDKGIKNLADVRTAGGLSRVIGSDVEPDDPALRRLEAHADLARVSTQPAVVERLIDAGLYNVGAVAEAPVVALPGAAADLTPLEIVSLQVNARAQTAAAANALTGIMADFANRGVPLDDLPGANIASALQPKCICDDCQTAVSPAAYLAELLQYTLKHVYRSGQQINIQNLSIVLYQPFASLPASCDAVKDDVRQVRLCIEALRQYLKANPPLPSPRFPDQLPAAEREYLFATYSALLTRIGTSYDEIHLARSAKMKDRQALAERLGVDLINVSLPWAASSAAYATNTLDALALDPTSGYIGPDALTEVRIEQIFGLIDTTRDPLIPTGDSYLKQWRLAHLRTLWTRQDRPIDPFSIDYHPDPEDVSQPQSRLPVIDPDVIGPDDFRDPTVSADYVGTPKKPFDLWRVRRDEVDSWLKDFQASRSRDINEQIKTILGASLSDLVDLAKNLHQSKDPEKAQAARISIAKNLHLSIDGFDRLTWLRNKQLAAVADSRLQKLTEEEWGELDSILVQAKKVNIYPAWLAQESSIVKFGPEQFWSAVSEPKEGEWPVEPVGLTAYPEIPRLPSAPFLDPDLVKPTELPEPTVGKAAIQLYEKRLEALEEVVSTLADKRGSGGFGPMLMYAFGDPGAVDTLLANLDDLSERLADDATQEAATLELGNKYKLSRDTFARLMTVRSEDAQADPAKKPTAGDYDEVYKSLRRVYKLTILYPKWLDDESQKGLTYWSACKMRLARWRGGAAARSMWRQALRNRSAAPSIDPDVLQSVDFATPVPGNPAFDRWLERRNWIESNLIKLSNSVASAASLEVGLQQVTLEGLASEFNVLLALDAARIKGEDITGRLDQLGVTFAGFTRLMNVYALARQGTVVPPIELETIYSILIQAEKLRQFGVWREEEGTDGVLLGPDDFKIPQIDPLSFPPRKLWEPTTWRSSYGVRGDWEDILQARIDATESIHEGVNTVVAAVEEATLPLLRDNIIMFRGRGTTTDLNGRAKWFSAQLFIDTQAGGCQSTTRVATAIEVLQKLLWGLRTRLLVVTHQEFELHYDHATGAQVDTEFDEDWRWIGSYSMWRAASFVFLYTENLLLPSLRTRQSSAFRTLIAELRDASRLTPSHVRQAVQSYEDYFRDVCAMHLDASCVAETPVQVGKLGPKTERRTLMYLFATGRSTGSLYWSSYDAVDDSGYGQSFWEAIPGLTGVISVAGAIPYKVAPGERFLFVFARVQERGKQKLVFVKYDLERTRWSGDAQELDLPKVQQNQPIDFSAIVKQRPGESDPPHIVVQRASYMIYSRKLNRDATDWSETDWETLATINSFLSAGLLALAGNGATDDYFLVLADAQSGGWRYALFGSRAETNVGGKWKDVTGQSQMPFRGAFCWPGTDELLMFLGNGPGGPFTNAFLIKPGPPPPQGKSRVDEYVYASVSATKLPYGIERIPAQSGGGGPTVTLTYDREGTAHRWTLARSMDQITAPSPGVTIMPDVKDPLVITERLSATAIVDRRTRIQNQLTQNKGGALSNLVYLEEAYYFVPVAFALHHQSQGWYVDALDWFRTVYDYRESKPTNRWIYPLASGTSAITYEHDDLWLRDPLNPHAIAATRSNVYLRFTLMAIVRCYLEYADAEFTRDTAESVPRARALYERALDLLDSPELIQKLNGCEDQIGKLVVPGLTRLRDSAVEAGAFVQLKSALRAVEDPMALSAAVAETEQVLARPGPMIERMSAALSAVKKHESPSVPLTLLGMIRNGDMQRNRAHIAFNTNPVAVERLRYLGNVAAKRAAYAFNIEARLPSSLRARDGIGLALDESMKIPFHPTSPLRFCIPPNPVLKGLRLRANLNLYKIRHCRNIAGMLRQLDPYAAPTDATSGMPTIGTSGQLVLPGTTYFRPTPYRFSALLDRSKQLAQMASQVETTMLAVLEKRDAEAYTLLKARQDIGLTRAGLQLQNLRVKEAQDSVTLAELQQDRARIQYKYFDDQLTSGVWQVEQAALGLQAAGVIHLHTAAAIKEAMTFGVGGIADVGGALIATASWMQTAAGYERRRMEWEFQKSLALQDIAIGGQQVTIANDHVRVIGQEGVIAQLEADNAEASADFLANKFTNPELYGWMSNILGRVYGFFLQQATAMAKLAENQLAFERHETPPAIIKADYWTAPTDDGQRSADGTQAPDRRGLTGSARLLQDVYELDQYAFNRNQRKLQVTKTVSLAQLAPVEFQQMKETGVMIFRMPMQLFDRDFPGHYLRLIKRVRVSVVALIPPTQGIRMTLSTLGLSRVVIGGDIFQTEVIRRSPESVALSSPMNASGIFELEQQNDLLLPFEGTGIDTTWELRMPRAANPFDFSTVADVLLSIDYTALDSFDYRQQIIETLPSSLSAERPFSFHYDFADAWYDLLNPDQSDNPMNVTFETRREDFPPNLSNPRIQHVVLYVASTTDTRVELQDVELHFSEQGASGGVGGRASTNEGVVSTRRGNAGAWSAMVGKSAVGQWTMGLPNTGDIRKFFDQTPVNPQKPTPRVADILLVITYSGRTPEWPQ